jgi:hypothetical protein
MGKRAVEDDQLVPREWLVARENSPWELSGVLIKTARKKTQNT